MFTLIKKQILDHRVLNKTNYSIKPLQINKTIKIFNIEIYDS
jgi:hypothetical protein